MWLDTAVAESITSSGTSQATTVVAPGPGEAFVRIKVDGGDVHVKPGASPTATTSHTRIFDGQTIDFGILGGDKIAVIDAS